MIDIKEVTSGGMDGQYVWICDLRFKDYMNKPIRHIKPMRVLVRSNTEIKKTIYYSESHFVGLNSKDEIMKSKVFAPYDTTGYRSYTGIALSCFDNEKDCVKYYKKQCKEAVKGLKKHKEYIIKEVDDKIVEFGG